MKDFRLELYYRYQVEDFVKGIISRPRWFLMRKIGRFNFIRSVVSSVVNGRYRLPLHETYSETSSIFKNINTDTVVEALNRDGVFLGINLPKDIIEEILLFSYSTRCYGHKLTQNGFFYSDKEKANIKYGKPFLSSSYFNTSELCPAVKRLESDPVLLNIAAKFLKSRPVHIRSRIWWNFVSEAKNYERYQAAQIFHYDLDDYKFLKFFFYLTKVDLCSGPHVCVLGSHHNKKLSHLLPRKLHTDKEIIDYYGADNIKTICGEPGFGFAEDTFCFHKAAPPINRDRLILQIQFGIFDYQLRQDIIDPSKLKNIL